MSLKPLPNCITCQVKNISLLRNCSNEILQEFSDRKTYVSVNKGERLLTEGEETKSIYCIRSGIAKVEVQKDNQSLILRLEGKGTIIGYRMAEKKDKQPLSITAVENMQACQLSAEKFRLLAQRCPGLRTEITRSLLKELQSVEKRALSQVYHSVRERVAGMLLHIAAVYQYHQNGCSIHVQLNRQEMADLAGTTKEQVSVALAALRQSKLVNFKAKHFKYFDLEGLRKIAEQSLNE